MTTVVGSQQPIKVGIRILRGKAVFYAESDEEQLFAQTFDKHLVCCVINPAPHRIDNSTSETLFIPTPSSRVLQLLHN